MTDFEIGLIGGLFISLLGMFGLWHIEESNCQQRHTVADCEWSQNPFLPPPPTDEKE